MTSIYECFRPYFDNQSHPISKFLVDPKRYRIEITNEFSKANVGIFRAALASNKFSGRFKGRSNIGTLRAFAINVIDTTSVSSKPVDFVHLSWEDMELATNHELLAEYLSETKEDITKSRSQAGIIDSKEELNLKGKKASSSVVDITLPSIIGKYSSADKAWFKWFVKDSSGNVYLYTKSKSCIMVPILEGAVAKVKQDADFWSIFWKNYRDEINIMLKAVETVFWNLHTGEANAANKDTVRESPIITEDGDFSALQKIHEVVPKLIMSRLGAKYTYIDLDDTSILKSIVAVIRETSSGSFKVTSEENIQAALSTIIPLIDTSELETVQRYADSPYGVAIHRIQSAKFKADLPSKIDDVRPLPPMWDKFFENRLGDQKFSSMYRIAKWITGVVDAGNYSRKILVIAGHGMDGKSLFINTLKKGFNKLGGEGFAREMPSDAVTIENNTQNGLLDCMDARLITSSDIHKVTEFINSQTIKNITGGDVVTAQVKYRNPVSKSMQGTKIAICTNYVTYMSDTFVESRVSPVCFFHIRKPGEPDWDQHKVSAKMVEEFNDFVRWSFEFAYAVECERNIPHEGDQPIWCDGKFETVRDMWNAIGSSNDEDGMFRYRMSDANAEILEEDIECFIDDIFYKGPTSFGDYVKVGDVRKVIGNVLNIKFRDAGADKRWNLVSRIIQKHFEIDPPKKSNGIRKFFGIGFKKGVDILNKKSVRPNSGDDVDTGMPC